MDLIKQGDVGTKSPFKTKQTGELLLQPLFCWWLLFHRICLEARFVVPSQVAGEAPGEAGLAGKKTIETIKAVRLGDASRIWSLGAVKNFSGRAVRCVRH